ncbi:MAG: leucine-rich repeat protein, partial [Prevotellaceae bacterium]|nr:leucine-rich repeat protein [Prevotellaceae bacterium]
QQFAVTAYNGTKSTYLYTVEKSDLVRDGAVILKTQADVDDFGQGSYTVLNGHLTIGATTGTDDITSLAPLASLKSVGSIVVNTSYHGDLTAFENLETVGELQVLSKYVRNVSFPKLTAVRQTLSFDQYTASTGVIEKPIFKSLDFPELTIIDRSLQIYYADSLVTMNFPALQQVGEDINVEGKSSYDFDKLKAINFPKLTAVGGTLRLFGVHEASSFTAPQLATAGGVDIELCAKLAEVNINALTTVGDLKVIGEVHNVADGFIATPALQVPNLTTVKGTLYLVLPNPTSLSLPPALEEVGTLTLSFPAVTSLTLPASLKKVGTLNVNSLKNLSTLDITGIEEIGSIIFSSNHLSTTTTGLALKGPDIFPGSLVFNFPVNPTNILMTTFPITVAAGFKEVGGLDIPVTNSQAKYIQKVVTIDLSWLERVTGTLNIGRFNKVTDINLSNLTSVGGLVLDRLDALTTLNLSKLETIGESGFNYIVWSKMAQLELPELTSVAGNIVITAYSNSTVQTISFPKLTSITGTLTINTSAPASPVDALTGIAFGALKSAAGVTISSFPNLKDFCSLSGVIPLTDPAKWSVTGCGYNPTHQNMVEENCSQ